jgi:hypothetical protein
MATSRVTATEVKNIIKTDVTNEIISDHIRVANELVTTELGSESLGEERLRSIELYLSAHFTALYSPSEGMAVERAIGTSRDRFEYQGMLGPGLSSTRFGGMVVALDTSKKLSNLNKSSATFGVYGNTSTA